MKASAGRFAALAKRGFRALGLEVQRLQGANTEEAILRNLLRMISPVAVLDVGANVGQFAASVRAVGYAGLIVSFEALPGVHEELSRRASADDHWRIAPCAALGSAPDNALINVAANTASSSLLPMCEAHLAAAPESAYVGQTAVRVERLDALAAALVPAQGELYLKIDTQGYELEVLKGAGGLMPRIAAMQIELSFIELYAGAPTLARMVAFLSELGYELFNLAPGFKDRRSGRLLQADGFFVRRDLAPDTDGLSH
jgi:FkbM family methyltransferase